MDLKEIDILGSDINNHWYYQSKAAAIRSLLKDKNSKTLLDIGAGSGYFSTFLLEQNIAEESWCVDISYEKESDALHHDKPIYFRKSIEKSKANTVLLMDVLEHVDDDHTLLESYVQKVSPGTHFVISVPAFQFLWSNHDEFLDHKRRYTNKRLNQLVQGCGLEIEKSCYFYGTLFPIATAIRIFKNINKSKAAPKSELKKHSMVVNTLLKIICYAEVPMMQFNRTAGLTVFCLAKKAHP